MEKKIRRYSVKIPHSDPKNNKVLIFDSYREASLAATENNTIIGGKISFIYDYE